MKPGILLLEDEKSISTAVKAALEFEGYTVFPAENIESATRILSEKINRIHILILDVMLPDGNGFDAFQKFKKKYPHLKAVFVTAKIETSDRVKGLKLGADDYITKPFDLDELLIRLKKIEQFMEEVQPTEFIFKNGRMDFASCRVWDKNGKMYELSFRENQMLRYMVMNRGKAVSREEIIRKCWNDEEGVNQRTIDNFIVNFRKIFEEDPSSPQFFKSVRGLGYLFDSEITD